MAKHKQRIFDFNEDMDNDLEFIKNSFVQRFKVRPSNTQILNLLIKSFKEQNMSIQQQPKKKRTFLIRL